MLHDGLLPQMEEFLYISKASNVQDCEIESFESSVIWIFILYVQADT